MHHRPDRMIALHDRVLQRPHRKRGLHTWPDGVADNPVRPDVFRRAHIQATFVRPLLGNVGQPQPVRTGCGELALDKVITHRGTGTTGTALTFGDHRTNTCLFTQPPYTPFSDHVAQVLHLVSEEPVPELRVLSMELTQHLNEMLIISFSFRHWLFHPLVVRLL